MATKTAQLIANSLTAEDLYTARARARHEDFMRWCWQRIDEPFRVGIHTHEICRRIDNAIARYREGLSTYLIINVPVGHGKSEISSRYLPAHFIGEFPDTDIIVASHTDKKVYEFSGFARDLISTPEYNRLYPHLSISNNCRGVEEWKLSGHLGCTNWFGIGSGSAGIRGGLIVLDDYFGKRWQAESADLRDKTWQSFCVDLMGRRAPVTIVLLVVTPWHVDDIVGRIQKEMQKNPEYPHFDIVNYPGISPQYKNGYLFPERYSAKWYEEQKLLLGKYDFQALIQCDPQIRTGNLIRTDKVHIVSADEWVSFIADKNLQFKRGWDLASSSKQTTGKNDPDFTVGTKAAVDQIASNVSGVTIPILYVDDVVRGQWEATQRQRIILDAAIADGSIDQGIEAFAAYKDAYTTLRDLLAGIRNVIPSRLPGDKVAKAQPLIPVFEAGNVYIKAGPWNDAFLQCINQFPGGAHDDDVDSLSVVYDMCVKGTNQLFIFGADIEGK